MVNGYLKINVYNDTIANPVKGAIVTISKDNRVISKHTTDENGQTGIITLETVNQSYSENEQYTVRPYETYDVEVTALGLTTTTINGVQIFDNITSIQDIYMTSIDQNPYSDTKEIDPNTLWGNYPPNITIDENSSNISPIILKQVLI